MREDHVRAQGEDGHLHQGDTNPADTLTSDSRPPGLWENTSLCRSRQSVVWQPAQNNTPGKWDSVGTCSSRTQQHHQPAEKRMQWIPTVLTETKAVNTVSWSSRSLAGSKTTGQSTLFDLQRLFDLQNSYLGILFDCFLFLQNFYTFFSIFL